MPKKNLRRQMLRRVLILGALLSLFFVAETRSPRLSMISSESRGMKGAAENYAGNQTRSERAAAHVALMRLPISFEAAQTANQFLVQRSGYRLLLKAS